MSRARREVQLALVSNQVPVALRVLHVVGLIAGDKHQLQHVAQPAGVVHEVAQRDRLAEVGDLGQVVAHVVVEDTTPCSASVAIANAVNCLDTEAIEKIVDGVTGTPRSRSAMP